MCPQALVMPPDFEQWRHALTANCRFGQRTILISEGPGEERDGRMKLLRNVAATIAAILAAGVVVSLIELPGNLASEITAEDLQNPEKLAGLMEAVPLWAKMAVVVAWSVGSLVAGFVGRRLAAGRSLVPGLLAVGLLLVGTLMTLFQIPHPIWMSILGPLLVIVLGLVGIVMAGPTSYWVTAQREINATSDQVFQVISSPEGFQKAVDNIVKIEYLTEQQSGAGTRFRETRNMNGREAAVVLEIAECESPERVRMVSDEAGTIWDTAFSVSQNADQTVLQMAMEARPHHWLARLLTPALMPMISKAVEADLDHVKDYCEANRQATGGE